MDLNVEKKTVIEMGEEPPRSDSQMGVCPVCDRLAKEELISIAMLPASLQEIVTSNAGATSAAEVCSRCVELFNRAQRQTQSHAAIFEQNEFVLPTPLRMDADERFTGRGATMA